MSKEYFQSLTMASSWYWDHIDQKDWDQIQGLNIPIVLIVGGKDKKGLDYAEKAVAELEAREAKVDLIIQEADDRDLASLQTGAILSVFEAYIRNWIRVYLGFFADFRCLMKFKIIIPKFLMHFDHLAFF